MSLGKREDENVFRDNSYDLHAFKPFRRCYTELNPSFTGSREKRKFANLSNNNIASMINEPNNEKIVNNEKYNQRESRIYTSNVMDNIHNISSNYDLQRNISKVYRRVPIKVLVGFSDGVEKKNYANNLFNYEDKYSKIRKEKVNELESCNNISPKNLPLSRPNINFEKMRASTRKYVE
uniref:Homeobox-containing protein n=1 Tax=Strongyloides venezuelensis TaxID=75913 RepID=A0A0K0EUY5_STRVS